MAKLTINNNVPGYLPDCDPVIYDVDARWVALCPIIRDYCDANRLMLSVDDSRAMARDLLKHGDACARATDLDDMGVVVFATLEGD